MSYSGAVPRFFRRSAVALAAVMTLSCEPVGVASSLAGPQSLPQGTWGGDGIELVVTADSTTVMLDCAYGATTTPLEPGTNGAFESVGWMVFEDGGPRDDERQWDVRFSGAQRADTVELSIVPLDKMAFTPRTYVAIKGAQPNRQRCL